VRLLPPLLAVSATGRSVRRARSAVAKSAPTAPAPLLVRPALSSVTTGSVPAAAPPPTAVAVRHARVAPAHVQQTQPPFLPTSPVQDGVLPVAAPPAFATRRLRERSAPAAEILWIASAKAMEVALRVNSAPDNSALPSLARRNMTGLCEAGIDSREKGGGLHRYPRPLSFFYSP
jgi:hypothetical protein